MRKNLSPKASPKKSPAKVISKVENARKADEDIEMKDASPKPEGRMGRRTGPKEKVLNGKSTKMEESPA